MFDEFLTYGDGAFCPFSPVPVYFQDIDCDDCDCDCDCDCDDCDCDCYVQYFSND